MASLRKAGFQLMIVSNQTVVARGLMTEDAVRSLQLVIEDQLIAAGGPRPDAFYFCPHHPEAEVPAYRAVCDCRKPRPGMLLAAAGTHGIDLRSSFLVGDRTVLVETGRHLDCPITLAEPLEHDLEPDHRAADLAAAARWILGIS
jgi:D-glycero-D-manno-heptose 1,7-bisphosphate phosphatase